MEEMGDIMDEMIGEVDGIMDSAMGEVNAIMGEVETYWYNC